LSFYPQKYGEKRCRLQMRVCAGLAIKFWLEKFGHKCLQGGVQLGKMDILNLCEFQKAASKLSFRKIKPNLRSSKDVDGLEMSLNDFKKDKDSERDKFIRKHCPFPGLRCSVLLNFLFKKKKLTSFRLRQEVPNLN